MKKYNILFVLNRSKPVQSGAENYIFQIIKSLNSYGYKTDIFTLNVNNTSEYTKRKRIFKAQEKYENIKIRRFLPVSIFSQKRIFNLFEKYFQLQYLFGYNKTLSLSLIGALIDKIKQYDIIVTGVMPFTQIIYPTLLISKLFNKPSVIIPLLHTGQNFDIRFKYEYFSKQCINLYNMADCIITINPFENKFFKEIFHNKKIISIYPHIEMKRKIYRYVNKDFNFITLGFHNYEKGILHTLKAFEQFSDNHNMSRLFILGNIDKEFTRFIKNKKNIIYKKSVSEKEKEKYFKNAHVFLLPSIVESFGIATLEAHSYSLPTINAYSNGSRLLVNHKKNGFLIPFADYYLMYEYMEILYKNKELYSIMSENAYKNSLRFNKKNHDEQIKQLIGEFIENN